MKLYNMNLSNFATKSRIVIYEKGANVEIAAVPGGDNQVARISQEINPLGKIPALDADGTIVAESETINEYFEDKFPNPPLLPKGPRRAPKCAASPGFTTSMSSHRARPVGHLNPKTRDDKMVTEKLTELQGGSTYSKRMLAPTGNFAAGPEFSLADCALAPTTFFLVNMLPASGLSRLWTGRPKFAAWWGKARGASLGQESSRRNGRGIKGVYGRRPLS